MKFGLRETTDSQWKYKVINSKLSKNKPKRSGIIQKTIVSRFPTQVKTIVISNNVVSIFK